MGNDVSQQSQSGNVSKGGPRLENDVKIKWQRCSIDSAYAPRDGHSAAAVNSNLFVFGGVIQTPDGDCTESNELLVCNTGILTFFHYFVKKN